MRDPNSKEISNCHPFFCACRMFSVPQSWCKFERSFAKTWFHQISRHAIAKHDFIKSHFIKRKERDMHMDHIDWRNCCTISAAFGGATAEKMVHLPTTFLWLCQVHSLWPSSSQQLFERCQASPFLFMFILLTFKHGFMPRCRHCLKSCLSHAWPSSPHSMQHATNLTPCFWLVAICRQKQHPSPKL